MAPISDESGTLSAKALAGKVAIVTGSSRGIGRAIAVKFGKLGASVIVNYAGNAAAAKEAVSMIEQAGGKAVAVQADVTKAADAERLVEEAVKCFGGLDILVNNAGIFDGAPLGMITEEHIDRTFNVNVKSVILVTNAAAKVIRNNGAIVSIGTAATHAPFPNVSVYLASKGAIEVFSRTIALELADKQVTVNVVSPGYTNTDMISGAGDEFINAAVAKTPLKRLGTPEDIASTVAFLASGDGHWFTGQNLLASGGVGFSM